MALVLGSAAVVATMLGGLVALVRQDKLHLVLGFSAGAVLGVALFDLLPESLDWASGRHSASTVALFVAVGFFAYVFLNRVLLLHPEDESETDGDRRRGAVGAASLSLHSFLDGVGIGLAFQVSVTVGVVVAAAVLAHDFSDGINTVAVVLRNRGQGITRLQVAGRRRTRAAARRRLHLPLHAVGAAARARPGRLLWLLPLHRRQRPSSGEPPPTPESVDRRGEHSRGKPHLAHDPPGHVLAAVNGCVVDSGP